MEFVKIKKDLYLSVDTMNHIYNNFIYLKNKIESFGLTLEPILDSSVTYEIDPEYILEKFNSTEKNIQIIHKVLFNILGHDEKFYKKFSWHPLTTDRKNEVWRWIDWLNNLEKITIFYEELRDLNSETIIDKNNEPIFVITAKE